MARIKIKNALKSKAFIEIFNKILIRNGKKKLASRIIQKSLNIIENQNKASFREGPDSKRGEASNGQNKARPLSHGNEPNEESFVILERAIRNTTPSVEIQTRRIRGSVYPIPVELDIDRGTYRAIRWIIAAAKKRSGKTLEINLSNEILDASKKVGSAFYKKQEVHKIAEKNPRSQKHKKKKKNK
uniref:Ribosomal protein S7 n=1 Tax=Caulerpa cliftonii TaxID=1004391 RepID=A0A1C9JBN0_9CHLO|nr:ribosomal protein S7 [Caulerpa cliftonii]AOP19258.1 ribosomal protein S7 [Caulerpa cliftonii]